MEQQDVEKYEIWQCKYSHFRIFLGISPKVLAKAKLKPYKSGVPKIYKKYPAE